MTRPLMFAHGSYELHDLKCLVPKTTACSEAELKSGASGLIMCPVPLMALRRYLGTFDYAYGPR